ncbi:hypothetical protein [Bdellovibrio sp. HCB337]|uniref:hypothetical protein n=1 Tax=Bdellovibrio sp. HCB337 TaxID=3394358 RepID=UPI0039A61290
MFNSEVFKSKTKELQAIMKIALRGKLDEKIEIKIIDEFSEIYLTMTDKYSDGVQSGKNLPALQRFAESPEGERVYLALLDLLERMELDFSQKFAMDLKHDLEKEIEIGKIKLSFLDGIRRRLHFARVN